MVKRILITGGAGFVGSSLALLLRRDHTDAEVIAFDNLHRPGSGLNVSRLETGGVRFVKGDVRSKADLENIGSIDCLIECSAEPSVHAGYGGEPGYLLDTNLIGAINCLEHLRRHGGDLVFLSTSRVYPIAALRNLPLIRDGERFKVPSDMAGDGWSSRGISEEFPLDGPRSLYGATKLSAELLIAEYQSMYGMRAIVNRCGVLAGPWQMGKVDQGFIAFWLARHLFGGTLKFIGFGGDGYQVRDILHPEDLYDLLVIQMANFERFSERPLNLGGGAKISVSLRELTSHCAEITGSRLDLGSDPQTRDADVPYYISDTARITEISGWRPRRTVTQILEEIHRWLVDNRAELEPVFEVQTHS